jgi:hypothetical protein
MLLIGVGGFFALRAVGLPGWLAWLLALLAAVSLERESYARRGIRRLRR